MEVVSRARRTLGLSETVPARAWRVERLDQAGEAYYLVIFGPEPVPVGVATVDVRTGDVSSSVRLTGENFHLTVDEQKAARLSGLRDVVSQGLVWKPCRASFSPLYPFWRISTVTKTVYVDQHGRVWDELPRASVGEE